MTCKHGHYESGKPVCDKGYPMQLLSCMGKGKRLPCYRERKEGKK